MLHAGHLRESERASKEDAERLVHGATRVPRGCARVHINSAGAEESPRSHVNHRDKMAPPYFLGAMCTQRRSGNARSMFEKRKRGSSGDQRSSKEERRKERKRADECRVLHA